MLPSKQIYYVFLCLVFVEVLGFIYDLAFIIYFCLVGFLPCFSEKNMHVWYTSVFLFFFAQLLLLLLFFSKWSKKSE